jgi:hypothetical protein
MKVSMLNIRNQLIRTDFEWIDGQLRENGLIETQLRLKMWREVRDFNSLYIFIQSIFDET